MVFRTYGYGLFFAAPFVIAFTTAYIANHRSDTSWGATVSLALVALALGALGLTGVALEGAICLVLAAPLIAAMGVVGALFGREIAKFRRRRRSVLMSVAVFPLLLVAELAVPPSATFESIESIEIHASPTAVWNSIVHMGPIPGRPSAPFRWGLAYPMRGEITGSGVGAVRRGVFSTGVAYERVTTWEPGRKLDFIVLSDPPTMQELSPYRHVNAPHADGYFRTRDARFTITPLAHGITRLTLATQHDLDLEPAIYWSPMAQWAVHANKTRVLRHFRDQAEAG